MFWDKLRRMPVLKLIFAGSVQLLKGGRARQTLGVARQLCSAADVEVYWNIPQEWGGLETEAMGLEVN